jgi:glc operon protein GlcG
MKNNRQRIAAACCFAGALLFMLSSSAFAGNPVNESALEYQPRLSLEIAERIIDTCIEKQNAAQSSTMAIAVFDAGGNLVAFKRMKNVSVGAVEAALSKGKSAAVWGYATGEMSSWFKNNPALSTLNSVVGVAGGVPIKTDRGLVIGGVGVSGGPASEDEACAMAGVQRVQSLLQETP